jgi:GNAT superfamily N-acetyltransferase
MGLNYTAVDQSVEDTSRRLTRGECYIARSAGTLVGTIVIEHFDPRSSCEWFAHPDNASAHQLAVDPASQTRGIGSLLMSFAERWAIERNYRGLAIDTAEPARHLIEFYTKRDYSPVGLAQWKGKCYRSIIMRKELR